MTDRTVLAAMVREEFRLHSRLFGGRRFLLFPVFVAAAAGFGVWALDLVGTDPRATVGGIHALVALFGLHTGTAGLVGSDAMEGVLDETTLLVFSSRTLPLSRRRLIALFVVQDTGYYAALFLLPIAVALAPFVGSQLPLLVVSLSATFAFGLVITFTAIALSTRGIPGRAFVFGGVAAAGVAWWAELDPLAVTPYAVYREPLSVTAAGTLLAVPALAAAGALAYDPSVGRSTRTVTDRFGRLSGRVGPLVAKSLLDVARSGGGLWKVAFSGGIIFVVVAFLLSVAESVTGRPPATGVSFGALLALTAFTTYNWLTTADKVAGYQQFPIAVASVFDAKFVAFLLVGGPAALGYYALAVAAFGATPVDAAVGLVLLAGLSVYLYGVTVFLTGFSPNDFLFDTLLFAAFTAAVAIPLVPVLVAGFVLPPSPAVLGALAATAVAAAAVGLLLARRAAPRWTARYRN